MNDFIHRSDKIRLMFGTVWGNLELGEVRAREGRKLLQ